MEEEKIGGLCKWKVEGDLRSLRDAEKIKGDSKRMNAVRLLAKEELGVLAKVAGEKKKLGSNGYEDYEDYDD